MNKQLFLDYLVRIHRSFWCNSLEPEVICLWRPPSSNYEGSITSWGGTELHTAIICKRKEDKDYAYYYFRPHTLLWAHDRYSGLAEWVDSLLSLYLNSRYALMAWLVKNIKCPCYIEITDKLQPLFLFIMNEVKYEYKLVKNDDSLLTYRVEAEPTVFRLYRMF